MGLYIDRQSPRVRYHGNGKTSLPGVGLLIGLLPVSLLGTGFTPGGVSDDDEIATLIRKRQARRKG